MNSTKGILYFFAFIYFAFSIAWLVNTPNYEAILVFIGSIVTILGLSADRFGHFLPNSHISSSEIHIYRLSTQKLLISRFFSGLMFLLGAMCTTYVIFFMPLRVGAEPAGFWVSSFIYFFATAGIIVWGSIGIRNITSFFRLYNLKIWFIDRRLMVQIPGEKHAIPWDKIHKDTFSQTIRANMADIPILITDVYRLRQDGTKVKMDLGLQDITFNINNITNYLLSRYIEYYHAGEEISFGQVVINKHSLTVANKLFTWKNVKDLAIEESRLTVQRQNGETEDFPRAGIIPNAAILEDFVDYIVSIHQMSSISQSHVD